MVRRVARSALVSVLLVLMAVTPLSALISPGQFEVRFDPRFDGLTVRLDDRTGLVRGLSPASPLPGVPPVVTNRGLDSRTLVVTLEGSTCDYLTDLTFKRDGDSFVITERTETSNCLGSGAEHVVAFILWAPVDASKVRFESIN